MHYPIRERLEEYLRDGGASADLRGFRSHMETCADCRKRVMEMETQAQLLKSLRAPAGIEPNAGFYARVLARIDSQRPISAWSFFLEPSFSKWFVTASLILVALAGSYMVSSEMQTPFGASSPVVILASEPSASELLGSDPTHDRDQVLVALATYQE